jgi:hypothetical protein
MEQRGVYVGKARVREFLNLIAPVGLHDGELNDHVQLQIVVHVAADGRSAKARSRLWNDLANLFPVNGSIELAQRGAYIGRERVRAFLFNVFVTKARRRTGSAITSSIKP